jgi:hypothetical protein
MIDHIDAANIAVRSLGPVTRDQIAREIRNQVGGAHNHDCADLADQAICYLLYRGIIERYDRDTYTVGQNMLTR